MTGALGAFQDRWGTDIVLLCAGWLIILAPSVLLFVVSHKQFVATLSSGRHQGQGR